MNETVNQEKSNLSEGENNTQTEKSFTQAEVDAIISDRLKRERVKYEGFEELKAKAEKLDEIEEAAKTELQKATEKAQALENEVKTLKDAESLRILREKIASESGVPSALLQGVDEESCREQAKAILEFANNKKGYPTVKDGGEVNSTNKLTTAQKFAEWWDQQN